VGNEVTCVARIDGKKDEGKALLETSELIFRGAECRVKIVFSDIKSVMAAGGELRIRAKSGEFAFEIGAAADIEDKILLAARLHVLEAGNLGVGDVGRGRGQRVAGRAGCGHPPGPGA